MMMRCSGVTSTVRPLTSATMILRIVVKLTDSLPMVMATSNSTKTVNSNTASIIASRLAVSRSRAAMPARVIRSVVMPVIIWLNDSATFWLENLRVNFGGHLLQAVNDARAGPEHQVVIYVIDAAGAACRRLFQPFRQPRILGLQEDDFGAHCHRRFQAVLRILCRLVCRNRSAAG